jgi:hypothetical protein
VPEEASENEWVIEDEDGEIEMWSTVFSSIFLESRGEFDRFISELREAADRVWPQEPA